MIGHRMGQDPTSGILDFITAQAQVLTQPIVADLQKTVGLFLADKSFLIDAQNRATTADQLATAQSLYQEQVALEQQLGQVLPPIQAGNYDAGTVTAAAALYAQITMHRDAVAALKRQMGVSTAVGYDWSTIALYAGAAVAIYGLVTRRMPVLAVGAAAAGYGMWTRRTTPALTA